MALTNIKVDESTKREKEDHKALQASGAITYSTTIILPNIPLKQNLYPRGCI